MTLENGGCYCNGGCDKPDFSELEPVADEYAKIPGSLITILQRPRIFMDIYQWMQLIIYPKEQVKNRRRYMEAYVLYPV